MATWWHWQHRALGWLLGWGVGSTVVGAGMAASQNNVIRHVGIQAAAWGLIDAALAFGGRRGARQKMLSGSSRGEQQHQAKRFQKIVAVNAGLDVLYILGGAALVRRAHGDNARRGTGIGIMAQGVFLLIYDGALVWAIGRWRKAQA